MPVHHCMNRCTIAVQSNCLNYNHYNLSMLITYFQDTYSYSYFLQLGTAVYSCEPLKGQNHL